jgi:hypothetical protein
MSLEHVAVVSQTKMIPLKRLMVVAAALQKQVTRDFRPHWSTEATVDAFGDLHDVPLGYWHIVVRDDIPYNAAGIHLNSDNGQPFALVRYSTNWPLTVSHECLEMLADPFGSRIMAGNSIKKGQGRVEYLVEVCDPSEAPQFGYTVNGVLLSDFYTERFFDPVRSSGVQYSFTGAIRQPRQVLEGHGGKATAGATRSGECNRCLASRRNLDHRAFSRGASDIAAAADFRFDHRFAAPDFGG